MAMKRHLDVGCERCGDIGKQRWDTRPHLASESDQRFSLQEPNKDLMQADADAWAWFREWRDRNNAR
jgi:hypothetical protein